MGRAEVKSASPERAERGAATEGHGERGWEGRTVGRGRSGRTVGIFLGRLKNSPFDAESGELTILAMSMELHLWGRTGRMGGWILGGRWSE